MGKYFVRKKQKNVLSAEDVGDEFYQPDGLNAGKRRFNAFMVSGENTECRAGRKFNDRFYC